MKLRFVKYLFFLALVLLKLSPAFAGQEPTQKHFLLTEFPSKFVDQDKHCKHFVINNLDGSSESTSLFFEQLEETEEDDELKESNFELFHVAYHPNSFHFFIPEEYSDYLKPSLRSKPYGLRSQVALFIVFRFIRI